MRMCLLSNKEALRVKNNAAEFLKAYTTNTLDKPKNAFVDLKGQIVCTFHQMFISPEKVLMIIEKPFKERLLRHLDKYLKLSDTVIEDATEFKIYFDLDDAYEPERGEIICQERKGKIVGTKKDLTPNVTEEAFTLFRLKNNIPVQGVDYDKELLLNVANEEFVSYTKGCYLGQEIIARVHYRGKPPKRISVKSKDECTAEETIRLTSKCVDPETGKVIGFVSVENP